MEQTEILQEKTQEIQLSQKTYLSIEEKKICDTHGEYSRYHKGITGRLFKQECPTCRDERIEEREEAEKKWMKKEIIKDFLRVCNVPKRFRQLDINKIDTNYHKKPEDNKKLKETVKTVKGYLNTYPERLEKGASGFFSGECGTGKTMLACMMVENIIHQSYSAQYTTAWQLIQGIRQGYSKTEESISYFIDEYINKSFLVIDEVGVQHGTDDERILLYQVIDGRYNEVKPTILISNSKNPVEDGYLDLRTIDRLKEGGGFSITFTGESYRK